MFNLSLSTWCILSPRDKGQLVVSSENTTFQNTLKKSRYFTLYLNADGNDRGCTRILMAFSKRT